MKTILGKECGQKLVYGLRKRDVEIQEELKELENAREYYKEYRDWYYESCKKLNKIPDICFDGDKKEIVEHFEKRYLEMVSLIQGGKNESN